jgi:nitrate/TMAO reductase-like tetraheme cytochrome c subunit
MRRTRVMMILETLIMLLILQLSCATPKSEQDYEEPQVSSDQAQTAAIIPEVSLLADKHQANGMACSDCHKETPPSINVPTSVCLNCHADYQEVAASYINPHNAHMIYNNCGDCHHAHRISENQCLNCHSFDLQAP